MNRRNCIKKLAEAGAAGFAGPLFKSILAGLCYQASAQEAGRNEPKNLLLIQLFGGPARWMYDLILNPNGEAMVPAAIGTNYVGDNRYDRLAYSTTSYKGMVVPMFWNFAVPSASGGFRPVNELLNSMAIIRGITTDNVGHNLSARRMLQGQSTSSTLRAIMAEASFRPLPAVDGFTVQFPYDSKRGVSLVPLRNPSDNHISTLFSPFSWISKNLVGPDIESVRASYEQSIDVLVNSYASHAPGMSSDRQKARDMFLEAAKGHEKSWEPLVSKYQNLIDRAMRANYPGLNDKPIGLADIASRGIDYNGIVEPDLRSAITQSTDMPFLAGRFAIAEFLLTKNLSSCVSIGVPELYGIYLKTATGALGSLRWDQHTEGNAQVTYLMSLVYSALAACKLELFDRLKESVSPTGGSVFDDTLVYFAGEFNRNPWADGRASDHAFKAMSATLFNGKFQGPKVIGDIVSQSEDLDERAQYPGTWGNGARIAYLGGQQANYGHLHTSLATILGIPSPSVNQPSLVSLESGDIVSLIGSPKIVGVK